MFRITKNDEILATVGSVTWVKKQDNGSYALCDESSAHGVVIDGTVYHVAGKPEIEGVEEVTVGEISEFAYYQEQAAALAEKQLQTETALAELSILVASTMTV
jgi:hypothetical protein